MSQRQRQRQNFERFYLEKVAIGEGCGCAEQAIGMVDLEAQAKKILAHQGAGTARKTLLSTISALAGWLRS